MTKAEFLTCLDKRLQILKQHEREDILGEYAQHIELKMENGLNEEEAIRDFGDLEELAAEILDAYNVNPLYGKEEKNGPLVKVNMEELGNKASAFGKKLADGWETGSRAVWRLAGGIAEALKIGALEVWRLLGRMAAGVKHGFWVMVHWLPYGDRAVTEDGVVLKERLPLIQPPEREEKEREPAVRERRDWDMWNRLCNGCQAFGSWLWKAAVWCLRLCVLLFLVAPAAIGDCLALVLLGVLAVMVLQGYPLIGITIMTLGCLVCGVSFVWLVWDLMFGKKKGEEKQVWESENI